jgi:hypothetical protein
MNETSARKLLDDTIQPDGSLKATDDNWIEWPVRAGGEIISIDGSFSADQLEALAWWIRNTAVPAMPPEKPWILSK